jgi:hypothetical protein
MASIQRSRACVRVSLKDGLKCASNARSRFVDHKQHPNTRTQWIADLTERAALICPTTDFPKSCQVPHAKIIRFSRNANQRYGGVIPCLTEGRIAIVTTRRPRDAMDVPVSQDERSLCGRQSRVVLILRRWDQARGRSSRVMAANKPGTPGRARNKP